jgi:branched-chain amino acid transport system substrate-binding protein
MVDVNPARIGLLIDYLDRDGGFDENILPSLQLVADEFVAGGIIERPVEFVTRAVQRLPRSGPGRRARALTCQSGSGRRRSPCTGM